MVRKKGLLGLIYELELESHCCGSCLVTDIDRSMRKDIVWITHPSGGKRGKNLRRQEAKNRGEIVSQDISLDDLATVRQAKGR